MTAYITMMGLVALVVLPAYGLLRRRQLRRRGQTPLWPREVALALFILFCAGMAALLFDLLYPWHYHPASVARVLKARFGSGQDINLVPLYTIRRFIALVQTTGIELFSINLIGNVVMFVPIGFGLPLLWRRWQRWYKMLLCALLLPVCIEALQLFLPRSVDIDDVLLNALGVLLGWGLYSLAKKLWPGISRLAAGATATPGGSLKAAAGEEPEH